MSKVTYEEVVKKLIEIESELHQDDYDLIKDFIIQNHKPPTFDEVKSWWECHHAVVELYDGGIEISFRDRFYAITQWGELIIELPNEGLMNGIGISQTSMVGINLTIRYLEAQQKEEH